MTSSILTREYRCDFRSVIAIVGDFRQLETFASRAWSRLQLERARLATAADSSEEDIRPLPLCDGGDASSPRFRERLYQVLSEFDVWCIIACGTARNTGLLLDALRPLLIPVLVTVDSTVERAATDSGALHDGRILRLMPSNDLQAQTIVTKIRAMHEVDARASDAGVHVFSYPYEDDYVRDLTRAIAEQLRAGPPVPAVRTVRDLGELQAGWQEGVIVCVGYLDAARELLRLPCLPRRVIFSDGCHDARVRSLVQSHSARTDFHWVRPAFDSAEYALDAYLASRTAWISAVGLTSGSIHHALGAFIPFVHRVQANLERTRATHYRFRGLYNQRGGYVVDSLAALENRVPRLLPEENEAS